MSSRSSAVPAGLVPVESASGGSTRYTPPQSSTASPTALSFGLRWHNHFETAYLFSRDDTAFARNLRLISPLSPTPQLPLPETTACFSIDTPPPKRCRLTDPINSLDPVTATALQIPNTPASRSPSGRLLRNTSLPRTEVLGYVPPFRKGRVPAAQQPRHSVARRHRSLKSASGGSTS